ncbi:MAG: hypothetical protein ACYC0J_02310 [Gammaproteobacteria bacterium]
MDEKATFLDPAVKPRDDRQFYRFLVLASLLALPLQAYAIDVASLNAQSIINNIITQIPILMRLITAVAYVMGMYFIFTGVMKLKQYGEQRTMMSGEHHLKGPLIYLTIGAMLLYLPTSVQIGLSTFWTDPSPYSYQDIAEQSQWLQFIGNCFLIIQLFGTIAFIRGLMLLSHLGAQQGGGQPGTFAKGLTHIIAGIFCINIYQFVQVMTVTLFGTSFLG